MKRRILWGIGPTCTENARSNAPGNELGLMEDQLAFYDTLEIDDSAVQVLRDGSYLKLPTN